MGQTVDWLSEGPPRQGAPPILRWRSSLAGPTHVYHQGASQKEARRMQNHEVGFRWCCKPPRPACPFRRPPLDSAGLACGPAGLPCVPSEWSDLRLVQRPCEARFLGLEIGASQRSSGGGLLPARPPLRTVLESFPSYGSSRSNRCALCGHAAATERRAK